MTLSTATFVALMSARTPSPPPDAPPAVMREALFRRKFIAPEDADRDETPRDTVTEFQVNESTTQLVSWDQDGCTGPIMLIATTALRDADADFLLQRCREIYKTSHPERALRVL